MSTREEEEVVYENKLRSETEVKQMLRDAIDKDPEGTVWHVNTKHLMTFAQMVADKTRQELLSSTEEFDAWGKESDDGADECVQMKPREDLVKWLKIHELKDAMNNAAGVWATAMSIAKYSDDHAAANAAKAASHVWVTAYDAYSSALKDKSQESQESQESQPHMSESDDQAARDNCLAAWGELAMRLRQLEMIAYPWWSERQFTQLDGMEPIKPVKPT